MQVVSVQELISLKILPFDLYNQSGNLILPAGEVLTPGKLLKLRYIPALYKKDEFLEIEKDLYNYVEIKDNNSDYQEIEVKPIPEDNVATVPIENDKKKYENIYFQPKTRVFNNKTTSTIQSLYSEAVSSVLDSSVESEKPIFIEVRDKIIDETFAIINNFVYKSELKIDGDFDEVHGINVSILSTVLGYKLKFNEAQIKDVALAALLHDAGKLKIPKEILNKPSLSARELRLLNLHPQIGYTIIRKELGLPEHIAKVALEHHEKNDGSGYPFGISSDLISNLSQVVIVCNVYDEIMSNRSSIKVKNAKEALKTMMTLGSRAFAPNILYTFVHMSNYNDTTPVEGYIG